MELHTMPMPLIDRMGHQYGRLTVIGRKDALWLCQCACGKLATFTGNSLKLGQAKSCGCMRAERLKRGRRIDRHRSACACGNHVFVYLTNGFVGLASPEDACLVASQAWHANRLKDGQWTMKGWGTKPFHRMVLLNPQATIDHINGNRFDNRRSNLRLCSNAENVRNQKGHRDRRHSSFKGVTRMAKRGPRKQWVARIQVAGKSMHLGAFPTEEDAARAYDRAAIEHHGPFARTNAMLGLF